MPSPLLTTKLFIPITRPGIVARPELVYKLDAGMKRKLILVSAPAGYGKTTLLAEWIDKQSLRIGWVSLDVQDNDLNRFFSYIIASLRTIDIPIHENTLVSLKDPIPESVSGFLSQLINQISDFPESVYLVLDDYHCITNPAIHQALSFLLENLPQNMHLIIATRSDPLLRLAKLRAQGELCEIRVDDLRFTIEETVQYLNQRMGLNLSQPDITALAKKTEGWIVGLQLAGISLQKHPDKHQFVLSFAGDNRYIADYLFDEAFNSQPDHIQSFLLETSVLELFNAQLCNAVTGQRNSQTILAELDRANLFLVPLDSQRNWYRYHHLFGELLHNRLQHSLPDMTQQLHSRAAHWYAKKEFLNQAATHAIKAKDIHLLERLIQENMLFVLETGESHLFENQLSSFHDSIEEPNLWLCIARAWSSVFSGQIAITEDALQEAEALISTLKDGDDLKQMNKALGQISAIRGYIASLKGETNEEKNFAKKALELLPGDDLATVAFASMMIASAMARSGELKQAETACLEAIRATETIPNSFLRIDALCMLSQLQHMQGELHKTNDTIEEALSISSERQTPGFRHLPIIGFAKIRKSAIHYEWNELEQAENTLNQGLSMIEKWGEKDSYLAGVIQNALFSQVRGNTNRAFQIVRQGKAEAKDFAYWFNAFDVLETWLYAKYGKMEYVDQWLEKHNYLLNQQPTFQQEFVYRYLIRILILRGDFINAEKVIKSFLPIVERSDSIDRLIRTLILHSRVLQGFGDTEKAISRLTHALELAQPRGYLRTFIDAGEGIAKLLFQCAQQGIHKQYCLEILEAFPTDSKTIYPIKSDSSSESIVESLSQREIEVLQLIAEGCTNQQIAEELIVSLSTVKTHARNIFGKLGVKNRTEAVAKARLFGLLPKD